MPTYDKHVTFLNNVWGLNADTLPAMREAANCDATPVDPHFTMKMLNEIQCAGTDTTSIVEQLVEMGPSVNVLLQLSVYLNYTGQPTISVPRWTKHPKFQKDFTAKETLSGAPPAAAAASPADVPADNVEQSGTKECSPEVPPVLAADNIVDTVVVHESDNEDEIVHVQEERDDQSKTQTGIEAEEGGEREGQQESGGDDVLDICSPLRNPLLAPLAPPTADSRTLEMAMFVLWLHDFTPDHLHQAEFADPSKIHVPIATHNEIVLLFGTLRELLESGCEAIELLAYLSGQIPAPTNATAADADDHLDPSNRIGDDDSAAPPPVPPPVPVCGMEYVTRKALLNQLCLRFDISDVRYWSPDSGLYFMLVHTFRMCYAMATDVDELYEFSQGNSKLTLDQILLEVLHCSLQMPECLFGLANQMLAHQVQWIVLRGRLASPYDLVAMIPASNAQAENTADTAIVADLIDVRPRGRTMRSCFNRSERNSNVVKHTRFLLVGAASVLVLAGGLWASRQANARFKL